MFWILAAASLGLAAQDKSEGAAQPKWEYCQLDEGGASVENGVATGLALIRFAAEDGWRWEQVKVTRVMQAGQRSTGIAGPEATGKALTQLGRHGWELIAITLEGPADQQHRHYHFKRRAN